MVQDGQGLGGGVPEAQPDQGEPVEPSGSARGASGVQSVVRAFRLLEIFAANQGVMGLSQVAAESGLPLPTIHRVVRTLVDLGYLRQEPSRRYALGPRLLLLADSTSTVLSSVALPHLRSLVDALGETSNLAVMEGDDIAYVAQVPGRHSMRMFTEVGRRVSPHCTAVGKALLAQVSDAEARALLGRIEMTRHTDRTIVDPDDYVTELGAVRERGFALDEGEQEVGVRCVAVVVPHPTVRLAISVSGPAPRMTDELVGRAVPLLDEAARALAHDLA